jgi:hypothetical protein
MSDAGAESPPSIQFPWLDRHDFYRSGLPTRTLAGSFRERDPKSCADAQDLLAPSEIRAMFPSETQESPGATGRRLE